MSTALTTTTFSLAPRSFSEAKEYAHLMASSDLVPSDYRNKPANVLVAVAMGNELGLSPMQSLRNIAVINGKPCVWGDALLAICRAHRDFVDIKEYFTGEGDARTAVCVVERKGQSPVTCTFSVADAKQAGLWGVNTWKKYPDRMLKMRARGFGLRDTWADALFGLISAEEAYDSPEELQEITVAPPVNRREQVLKAISNPIVQEAVAAETAATVDAEEVSEPAEVSDSPHAINRATALRKIGAATNIEELKEAGKWIASVGLPGIDLEHVKQTYKIKQDWLKRELELAQDVIGDANEDYENEADPQD